MGGGEADRLISIELGFDEGTAQYLCGNLSTMECGGTAG